MRFASIVALVATTVLFASSSLVVAEPQDALALLAEGNASSNAGSGVEDSSHDGSLSSNEDSPSSGDSSSNEDTSGDGSGVAETRRPTPTPTPTLKSATPSVRAVHVRVKLHRPNVRVLESHCSANEDEMSVEGVEGIFCIKKGVGCSGERAWGKCPGRQSGLPHGSYCGRVASGVFGCKPGMPYGEVPDWDNIDENEDRDGSGSGSEGASTDGSGSG